MNRQEAAPFGDGGDPRMRGFKTRTSVLDLTKWIEQRFDALENEEITLGEACGRVLGAEIVAAFPSPPFDRAAMDGYAIRSEESFGTSAYTPASLRCVGRSRPGLACESVVGPAEAVEVATGAPLPPGADAVIPVELTRSVDDRILLNEAVPPGRNIGRRGEDIAAGTAVLPAGRILRPQDLGVLSAVGAGRLSVVRRPRVIVVITGDELLAPGTPARGFRIPDMNSVMLAALVSRDGGLCQVVGPLPDCRSTILNALVDARATADLILVSGASSAGPEDHVPGIVAELGRLIVHGVALRPAGPTGVALIRNDELPVVLLPGNPVSCLCAYDFFAGLMVRRLGGRRGRWPYCSVTFPLARKLTSAIGRVDYARVRVEAGRVEPLAIGGASILSSVSRADGFVIVPADLEGYPAGADVEVWCYDEVASIDDRRDHVLGRPTAADGDQSIRSAHQTPEG